MKFFLFSLYNIVLALWVGGVFLFTFIATPTIFRAFGRDAAGDIVGRLFPGYFLYNLVLASVALVLFLLLISDRSALAARLSLSLLIAAFIVNAYATFLLHPQMQQVKQTIATFEKESESSARKKFRALHAVSAVLNLLHLGGGVALLVASPLLKK